MVPVKMYNEYWSSHDERVVGDVDGFDFPLLEGSIPGRIAPLESKSAPAQVPPQVGGAPFQKSSLYFCKANGLIYHKMGTGGWPGAPQATRARPGAS